MRKTNRIALLRDVGRLEVVEEDVPIPGPGEVLVRVTHAGVCGSDLHYFRHGGLGSFKVPLPMYLGHEPAGLVADANGSATFALGDRVAVEPGCSALDSKFARLGKHNLCERGTFMGANGVPGCFADFVCVSERQLMKVPEHVGLAIASLCEPLAVALHTLKLCRAVLPELSNGHVVIFGGGAIGLCHLLLARHFGASNVYVVEPQAYRRALALKLGASGAFTYDEAFKAIATASRGSGCQLAVDCAGTRESFDGCIRAASAAGTVALVGIPEVDHLQYNPHKARTKELTIINTRRSNECLEACLDLVSNSACVRSGCEAIISHQLPLRAIQEAFEMASGYRDCLKIVLNPEAPVWRTKRIGFLGLSSYGLGYLRHLLANTQEYEVVYATSKSKAVAHVSAMEGEFQELCAAHGVPYLGFLDVNKEVDRLAAYGADLVILGGYDKILKEPFLRRAASHGVINTHLGLLPANRGCSPCMWAILEGAPQGFTTYFVTPAIDLPEEIIDIAEVEIPGRHTAGEAYDALSRAAVSRFPGWLQALRTGHFDMSMCAARRRGEECSTRYHKQGMPNDSYVSWHWRCRFIQKFSDALAFGSYPVARTEAEQGPEIWFRVSSVEALESLSDSGALEKFAASRPGAVLSALGQRFVVRVADGLVTCQAESGSQAPRHGQLLRSIGDRGRHGIAEHHCAETIAPPVAPPPPAVAAVGDQAADVAEAAAVEPAAKKRKVPIFRLEFEDDFVQAFLDGSKEILTSGRPLSESTYARKFEASFAELVQAPHALVTTSGTTALDIAFRALGVAGRTVVVPSNTFFATQVAALNAKAKLAWVDVEREYMQVCPRSLEAVLEQHGGDVAAVVLVHIAGIVSPHSRRIREICDRRGVKLVEDAAHAHLSCSYGERAGMIGHVAAFSFFATKVMTAGEAGMITTRHRVLYEQMRSIKEFGRDVSPGAQLIQARADGLNGRVQEFQCLLGFLECSRVRGRVDRRTALIARYASGLDTNNYRVVRQLEGPCAYYKCVVMLLGPLRGRRDELKAAARENDIAFTGEVYFRPVHDMPAYLGTSAVDVSLPVTDDVCANHVCPPLYPELSNDDVDAVVGFMNGFAAMLAAAAK